MLLNTNQPAIKNLKLRNHIHCIFTFSVHSYICYQVFLSNTNNLHTVTCLQVFLSNANILYMFIWFQVIISI